MQFASLMIKVFGKYNHNTTKWKWRMDIPIPISIKQDYMKFKCLSLASINNTSTIIIQPKSGTQPTGNILLMLDFKRWLVVLTLCVLLSNK